MANSQAQLDILLAIKDQASAALSEAGGKMKTSLEDVQKKANTVALTFGAMGAAITGALGLLIENAAKVDTVQASLNTTIGAAIEKAKDDTSSTSVLAEQKKALESQLAGVNARITEFTDKSAKSNAQATANASAVDKLKIQAEGLRDKLAMLNNEQQLSSESASDLQEKFGSAAKANTDLGFAVEDSLASFNSAFAATGNLTESLSINQEAMDLARMKNIDLSTATNLIDKAMQGSAIALKQYGINIKDGLTPTQALTELQQKLAGQAKAFADTPTGNIAVMKTKMADLAATLGNDLMPTFIRLIKALTDVVEKVTAWTDKHPQLTTNILLGAAALGGLFLGISTVAGAISASIEIWKAGAAVVGLFGDALAFLAANPIVLIIAAIAAIVVGIVLLVTHWDQAKKFLVDAWNYLKEQFIAAWTIIRTNAEVFMGGIMNVINTVLNTIKGIWNNIWSGMKNFFGSIWDGITSIIQGAANTITGIINSIISAISRVTSAIANSPVGKVIGGVSGVVGTVAGAVGNAVGAVGNFIGGLIPKFAEGGLVSSPTLALVGEAGPEYIIPKSKLEGGGSFAGNGSGITVNLSGNFYTEDQAAIKWANMIAKVLGQQLKLKMY